jgi:hypothetical protein
MEATLWRVKWFGAWIGAGIGGVLAYFAGFELIEKFVQSQDRIHLAANLYIVGLSAGVLVFAGWRQWVSIRKEKYANISAVLHQIMHQIRDLNSYIYVMEPRGGTKEAYDLYVDNCRTMFGLIMDQLNSIFMSITSTHCRTSVKLIYERGDKLYFYTLARDLGSRQSCLALDNRRVSENHDAIDQNPHLAMLINEANNHWHFISNYLPSLRPRFTCTSVTAYEPEYYDAASHPWNIFKKDWPLPYKSAIKCVIRQAPCSFRPSMKPEILGFLTVDSESRGVFEEKWDAQLMYAVADALYGPVRAFLNAQNRANGGHGSAANGHHL